MSTFRVRAGPDAPTRAVVTSLARVTETQREPVPRVDTGELDTALAFLDFARACVVKKLNGLDEEQVRRVLVPSGTSLLGLVQHLIVSEQYWFAHHVRGDDPDAEFDFGMDVAEGRRTADLIAEYRSAIAQSNAIVRDGRSLESLTALPVGDQRLSRRWVLAHMTSEVVRHAGHADILRELVDGTTGR
jgi:Protein of unknown function (DUF664)